MQEARDLGLIPGSGRAPGAEMANQSNTLAWKILDREAWQFTVHEVRKSYTNTHVHTYTYIHSLLQAGFVCGNYAIYAIYGSVHVFVCNFPWYMDCKLPGFSIRKDFFRQKYWIGLPFPSSGNSHRPEIKLQSLACPYWQTHLTLPLGHRNAVATQLWVSSSNLFLVQSASLEAEIMLSSDSLNKKARTP